jgi:hypothetical protein
VAAAQEGAAGISVAFLTDYPRLRENLEKLVTYYQGLPGETRRFTKDQAMLRQVAEVTKQRVALINDIIHALESYLAGGNLT